MNATKRSQEMNFDSTRPRRVLVVDDEELMRGLLKEILTAGGYEVTAASRGKDAVFMFWKEQFDVVIADIVMPDMDGIEVLLAVKEAKPEIPVIMITGYPSEETKARLMALGAMAYITKPFDAEALKLTVAEALQLENTSDRDRQANAAAVSPANPAADQPASAATTQIFRVVR